jgi:hypothetical protein
VKASGTPQVEPEIHNIVTLSSSNHFPSNRSNAKLAIELASYPKTSFDILEKQTDNCEILFG